MKDAQSRLEVTQQALGEKVDRVIERLADGDARFERIEEANSARFTRIEQALTSLLSSGDPATR